MEEKFPPHAILCHTLSACNRKGKVKFSLVLMKIHPEGWVLTALSLYNLCEFIIAHWSISIIAAHETVV